MAKPKRNATVSHSLTLDEDQGGWPFATCSCGWTGPPCPDNEIAAEFYTDHRMSVEASA